MNFNLKKTYNIGNSDDIWKPKSPASHSIPSTLSGEIDPDGASKIESQLVFYRQGIRPPIDTDIFSWWRENQAQYPELARLAQIFLSVPATSVCSERLFSKAGLLYANTLRNR
jgi:hypothetical protein